MKQEELTVWKNGEAWFTFPAVNEQNVMDMLMQKDMMQKCVILPAGEQPRTIKTIEIKQPAYTAEPKQTPNETAVKIPTKTVKRKPQRK